MMQTACRILAIGLALIGPVAVAEAGKVKVWTHQGADGFVKAQLKGTLVTSEGAVRLTRQLEPLANLDATHVWDLIEDAEGNLYAATGGDGKVYKIAPSGKVSVLYSSEDGPVLCLGLAADGAVLAGTGPGGQVIRIDAQGKSRVLFEQAGNYVWAIAVDARSGNVFAATGPHGRIQKITPEGGSTVFYQTKQDHILCLTLGADGNLYAGTDRNGLVYRINAQGKGFVIYQAPQSEVRRLIVTPNAVYACTSEPGKKRTGTTVLSGSTGGLAQANPLSRPVVQAAVAPDEKTAESKTASTESKEPKKGDPAPAPSTPGTGDNSVYRLGKDGSVREIFREKVLLLSMVKQVGRLVVGGGMEGQLFDFDEATRERGELVRLDQGQILSLLPRRDGSLVIGTGDPGKLYTLRDRVAEEGTLQSEVLDGKLMSQWGAMHWQAETPRGSSVQVAVRVGNVSEPDDTWSNWIDVAGEGESKITAPPARFLQYRAILKSAAEGSVSPAIRAITVRYKPVNLAPELTKLETPNLNAVNLENPRKVKVKWTATDPNEDELTYAVHVRKQGWSAWVRMESSLDKTEYEWDTTTTPAGMYQIKVVASDRKENGELEARTAEVISQPFVVCNVPPTVTVKVAGLDGDRVLLETSATSPLVRIVEASFAINGKAWTSVFPEDGLFDGPKEGFAFKTAGLQPGSYVLIFKVKDASGNVGSADAVFTVNAK